MVLAVVVYCVASLVMESTVLALLVLSVRLEALFELVFDHFVEGLVLAVLNHVLCAVGTVGAPHTWSVRAYLLLGWNGLTSRHAWAIRAASVGAVRALLSRHFFLYARLSCSSCS